MGSLVAVAVAVVVVVAVAAPAAAFWPCLRVKISSSRELVDCRRPWLPHIKVMWAYWRAISMYNYSRFFGIIPRYVLSAFQMCGVTKP